MSAAEIIEQIEQLEPEQKQEVISHFMSVVLAAFQSNEGRRLFEAVLREQISPSEKNVPAPNDKSGCVDRETFERVSKWALEEHRELLSRLAR